ncbi:YggS family pyridoxal phosphate-dependent enzyme [Paenibacillus sp. IB182496]|uniref:Pyridoxal phosphate homeostasis protein n=2 Tax=Paenibacillus sabuli TaxID=2772509 RepID=A0A927BVT7_9BACL|nr:YggS family pyridoxal phosphate-dependent enzyme [Paenibacillus sabuli]
MSARIAAVNQRLGEACRRSGRSRDEVRVIAVTKYVSNETASEAFEAGLRHLGENRWPDAKTKLETVGARSEASPLWHFIGSLQSRKVKDVVGRFAYVHSLDRLSLARAIDAQAQQLGITVPCMIQVNVSGEASKHGLAPEELHAFARAVAGLEGIEVAGLMTMAPHADEAEAARPVFRGLRELRDELNALALLRRPALELSMGMSGDFEVAVEEGATWVRLGSILVGREEENA